MPLATTDVFEMQEKKRPTRVLLGVERPDEPKMDDEFELVRIARLLFSGCFFWIASLVAAWSLKNDGAATCVTLQSELD
jgi:hypothetical protein